MISCKVNTPVEKTDHHIRTVWDIKSCNFAVLNESLINAPVDLGYELFEDVVHYCLICINQLFQNISVSDCCLQIK